MKVEIINLTTNRSEFVEVGCIRIVHGITMLFERSDDIPDCPPFRSIMRDDNLVVRVASEAK